ncbi:hypothetical protein QTO30_07800 [Yoonia sp. GPGPB17]|uniref:hypothetical protein n=1 Tax=Yoonia sp. GPGPB17 TaxID=3026147 RepID=UPI0030BEC6C3
MMSITNTQAKRKIGHAISDLLKVRDDYGGLTAQEKQKNEDAIKALKAEYLALSGAINSASYSEITAALTGAKTELEEIKDKRDRFENGLVTAAKLLGSLTAILKLIS